MREEKRGLIGRKTSLSNGMVGKSSIGISKSKTPRMQTDNTELLKYCAVGLTGSEYSPSSTFKSFMFLDPASLPNFDHLQNNKKCLKLFGLSYLCSIFWVVLFM